MNTNIIKKREHTSCIRLSECSLDDTLRIYEVLKLNLCWTETKNSQLRLFLNLRSVSLPILGPKVIEETSKLGL